MPGFYAGDSDRQHLPHAGAAVTVTVTFQESSASGELIISQYYEGASNNKWIEIYNPGSSAVDLLAGGYRLGLWSNVGNREAGRRQVAPNAGCCSEQLAGRRNIISRTHLQSFLLMPPQTRLVALCISTATTA
jgi:hypothetical protein